MDFLFEVVGDALSSLAGFGVELRRVIGLTLIVSLLATAMGVTIGVPLGAWIGLGRTRVRTAWLIAVNIGMGMPPVVAGLALLLVIWDTGPLGGLDLLFTPAAMVAAQAARTVMRLMCLPPGGSRLRSRGIPPPLRPGTGPR